jgi:hypothetical protein
MKKLSHLLLYTGLLLTCMLFSPSHSANGNTPNFFKSGFIFINKTSAPIKVSLNVGHVGMLLEEKTIAPAGNVQFNTGAVWYTIGVDMIVNSKSPYEQPQFLYVGKKAFENLGYFGDYFADKILVGNYLNYQTAVHIPDPLELYKKLRNATYAELWGQYAGTGKELPTYEITEGLYYNADAYAQLVSQKLKIRKTNTVGNGMMKGSKTQNF